MPTITKLKLQQNRKRVNIYLNGRYAFSLSLEETTALGLSQNQHFTGKEIEKLIFQSQLEKFYSKILNFLSYRPRSEKEIIDYLKKKLSSFASLRSETKKKIQEKILKKLKKQRLIDDREFALWWREQRMRFRPRGKRLIQLELIKKGVSKEIISQTLALIGKKKLLKTAKNLVEKKVKLHRHLPKIKLRKKLFDYLARRGFEFDLCKKAIDELLEKS